jgi:tRNA (cmo5U34)-methyltransferase
MQQHPSVFFDEAHAASYNERNAKLAPLRAPLDLLVKTILSNQPAEARILCVGAGTGAELIDLAGRFPHWRFTAVEPSTPMLDVCRHQISELGLTERCNLHHGFLDSLPPSEPFDAATSILVSHFVLEPKARADFFQTIAGRLRPGGYLVNADLAFDTASPAYQSIFDVWLQMMKSADLSSEDIEMYRQAYDRNVAIWPPEQVEATIAANGFEMPVRFYQAGLIHAWYARSSNVV